MVEKKINIQVTDEIHQWLTSLKVIKEEPFDKVLQKIKERYKKE